jgi:hypothetical protein
LVLELLHLVKFAQGGLNGAEEHKLKRDWDSQNDQ